MLSCKENGGTMARIGSKFHKEIEEIQQAKLKNGTGVDPTTKKIVSIEKLTNLITRHKYWKDIKIEDNIKQDLIKASIEEVNEYGK